MEDTKWSQFAKGLALGASYCGAYLLLWYASFNQWFLPAGLRAACLFLIPYRYWPFLFAGDAAALLVLRAPKTDLYEPLWCYLSPFLLVLCVSFAVRAMRTLLKEDRNALVRRLPFVAVGFAMWSSLCNLSLNFILGGPRPPAALEKFMQFLVGDFLGVLMVMIPCLLWLRRRHGMADPRKLVRDIGLAMIATLTLYAVVISVPDAEPSFKQFLLIGMVLPAVFLTVAHGWNGAAAGIFMVNLAISQTIGYTDVTGHHDELVFFVQQGLSIAAITLLTLGFRIAENYDKARHAGIAQNEALAVAQKSFLSSEQMLREHMLYMAQMQLGFDDERKDTVEWLRARGHAQAAMDLNTRGMSFRRVFDERAPALYPIRIEQEGLYAVLHADAFTRFWGDGAEVYLGYKGQPKHLSVDLQLASYRCICHAMALLSESEPSEYRIGMRVWKTGTRRGISISVTIEPTAERRVSQAGVAASTILDARVKAYGGILKHDAHRVRVLLSEPVARTSAAPQSLAAAFPSPSRDIGPDERLIRADAISP